KKLANLRPDLIREIRGRGLFNAIEIHPNPVVSAQTIVDRLRDFGIVTKATHDYNIRMAPALVITEEQLGEAIGLITNAFDSI
ncbi:aminotransferase class III-fold pyridoxal phosphate-dependent enzyme, partial [Salmonella sp. s51228]|uniref:aminotransferase class III-fold pyridoxal phosphate-dependent enzyme n=1 Tax=Salmonella sp. s51228 TaxID=3159652 RepID=UPI0039810034